ncbi:MAG: DUF1730 domain-containing protein [Muribaculum sp.]|nr:DUF1730 domain-containing protein [Muribaculum sp.]
MKLRKSIQHILMQHGACACAVCGARTVDKAVMHTYVEWLKNGNAADMLYLHKYLDIRSDPRLLLDNAKSIICCAFDFSPRQKRDENLPVIASYAYGNDYHDTIRKALTGAIAEIPVLNSSDNTWRICVDTAPIFERYWAETSGLGKRLDNGMIHVRGIGNMVFLAEIITTVPTSELSEESGHTLPNAATGPEGEECLHCGKCSIGCPADALSAEATIDARRCISYLTIEHRGEFTPDQKKILQSTDPGYLYGCDNCLRLCPLNNRQIITPTARIKTDTLFPIRDEIKKITADQILEMTQTDFSRIFKNSAIKRAKLAGMQRNAQQIKEKKTNGASVNKENSSQKSNKNLEE